MSRQVRVPIRVRREDVRAVREERERERAVANCRPAVSESQPVARDDREVVLPSTRQAEESALRLQRGSTQSREPVDPPEDDTIEMALEKWRDRALRLQAEMENFRKRQRRLAEDRIEEDRGRLLRGFLRVADDLERALHVAGGGDGALREGVEMTYRSMNQLLEQEGVEPIEARGEVFDPAWHEAVGTAPHRDVGMDQGAVVEVTQAGYRLDGRLLRPARVIVAQ